MHKVDDNSTLQQEMAGGFWETSNLQLRRRIEAFIVSCCLCYYNGLTVIPASITNHMPSKVSDEVTCDGKVISPHIYWLIGPWEMAKNLMKNISKCRLLQIYLLKLILDWRSMFSQVNQFQPIYYNFDCKTDWKCLWSVVHFVSASMC